MDTKNLLVRATQSRKRCNIYAGTFWSTNMAWNNYEGQTFNFWTVGAALDIPYSMCRCACGTVKKVNTYNVVSGKSKSCGCHASRTVADRNRKHGMSDTRAYISWGAMWTRCTNNNQRSYQAYKGRIPPAEWRDFSVFFAEMGECPPGYTLDRIDNSKPYGPGNCKWSSRSEQAVNKDCVTVVVLRGSSEPISLREACRQLGVVYTTVIVRIKRGMPIADALGHPITAVKVKGGQPWLESL